MNVLTFGKVSNLSKSFIEQNSCRDILEAMINKHMVNNTILPNFFPGPKICNTQNGVGSRGYSFTTALTQNLKLCNHFLT